MAKHDFQDFPEGQDFRLNCDSSDFIDFRDLKLHCMSLFLNNILPRIKQFSASLDQKELFVDKPWAVIDEDMNQQKYIFRRSGDLIMSLNGQVTMGTWEYLAEAKCILLDRVIDKILLNHNFLDPAVMILKMDGLKSENLILANEALIPDLDVLSYLQKILDKKAQEIEIAKQKEREKYRKANNIELFITPKSEQLEIARKNKFVILGSKVFKDGQSLNDGVIELYENSYYLVKDGEVVSQIYRETYKTKQGTITIETDENFGFSSGDMVYLDGKPAPDGKYKLGFLKYIIVEAGKIVTSEMF